MLLITANGIKGFITPYAELNISPSERYILRNIFIYLTNNETISRMRKLQFTYWENNSLFLS